MFMPITMEQRMLKKPLPLSEKVRLITMWMAGMTCNAIAVETGRSSRTVCRWINRWRQEGHVNTRPRRGRPRTCSFRRIIRQTLPVTYDDSHLHNVWLPLH